MAKTVDILGVPHTYELTVSTHQTCLVFVHGWLLSRAYWRPLVSQLQDYPCLFYDLRGFGESQAPPSSKGLLDRGYLGENPLVKSTVAPGEQTEDRLAESDRPAALRSPIPVKQPSSAECGSSVATQAALSSAVSPSPYSPAAYAQDLNRLLDALDIKSAWIVGHSLGGSIGLWAAIQSPERICGCICVNAGGGIYLKEEFEKFRNVGQQLVRLRPPWLRSLPLVDVLMARMNVAQPMARQWGRQRVVDLVTAESTAALGTLLESTTEEEVHRLPHVVSHLTQPVYFIAGDADDIMEPKYVDHLASFHHLFRETGQNVIKLPRCGHFAMIEQPERLAKEIKTILAQHADVSN